MSAEVLSFDLSREVQELRLQENYLKGDSAGRTLVKEPDLRVVLMGLKLNARMKEHHASGPISIHVMEGALRLRLPAETVEVRQGHLLMLEAGITHDVEAMEESAFLLTIGRTTYAQVADQHEP